MWLLSILLVLCSPSQAREVVPTDRYASKKGIYPVYEMSGQWVLLDRYPGTRQRKLKKNGHVLVIGSTGADILTTTRITTVQSAACSQKRSVGVRGYVLKGKSAKRIGTPLIAFPVPAKTKASAFRRVRILRLENQVNEDVYKTLGPAIQEAEAAEIRSGGEPIQIVIDFAASIPMGSGQGFIVIDKVQFSKSSRRCLRLFVDGKAVGRCAEMPSAFLAETNLLDFVSYDLKGQGYPTILAYTPQEPLWGHERWGFQTTTRAGILRVLIDALDPKCREKL